MIFSLHSMFAFTQNAKIEAARLRKEVEELEAEALKLGLIKVEDGPADTEDDIHPEDLEGIVPVV